MRVKVLAAMVIGCLALAGCSDDGDKGAATTSIERVPIDLSAASGTPFCQAYVKYVQTLEAAAENQGGERQGRELLTQLKSASAELAAAAPPDIKADADAFSQNLQGLADWTAYMLQPTAAVQVAEQVGQYVDANCSLNVDSVFQQLEDKGQAECLLRKESGANVAPYC